ncbi:MAG: hypothetical protein GWP59_00215 [Chlamydiales bacterium]|nr:hypothetical protein [Chlamydiales bacterium]NCF70103.1 hypothetical protein [Chlamydiales bacterium]
MISKKDLLKKIAVLESLNDQLAMELKYVDQLLKKVGFSEGLESVKTASEEIIDSEDIELEFNEIDRDDEDSSKD